MELHTQFHWPASLTDPSESREGKRGHRGKTMVIDKGLGLGALTDLLKTAGNYIDILKLGFGTAALYPADLLRRKINLAKQHQVCIMPGGTFLEVAISRNTVAPFLDAVQTLGFNGIEISDGTIELSRKERSDLITKCVDMGFAVFTEYGKKVDAAPLEVEQMIETLELDLELGAELATVEGRESGINVGIYDQNGDCEANSILSVVRNFSKPHLLLWETPLKSQQVQFIHALGPNVNLGNVAPDDVLSVEALRRGLRADTFITF